MFTELFPGLALEELALEELSLEELAREELALEELAREALAGLRSLVGEPEFLSFRGLLSLSLGGQGSETNKKFIILELLIAGKPADFPPNYIRSKLEGIVKMQHRTRNIWILSVSLQRGELKGSRV